MNPETLFPERQQQFTSAAQAAQRQFNQLAFWRLVWFIGSLVATWAFIQTNQQLAALVTLIAGVIGFLILLKKHQQVRLKRDLNQKLAFINQDESARLKRQYLRPETGEQFASPTHYYTGDLDVFGKHSLFRLLNRTHTYEGQNRLATWLKAPSSPDSIRLRHQVVDELKPQMDWRQQFEGVAYIEEKVGQAPTDLIKWATAEITPLPGYLTIVRFLFPAITLSLFIAWLAGYLPGMTVLLALAVHGFILSQTAARAKEVSEQTFEISAALRAFRSLFQQAEQLKGDAIRLRAIRQALSSDKQSASEAIGSLAKLTEGLNFRRNPYFFLLFGIATLWDIQYLYRLERWRQNHGPELSRWFEALGELEALNSLAGFAYAHPDYTTPDIVDDEFVLDFTLAAHPLLPPDRSIANSLKMAGSGQTILITGSNMSGKSTFLRTIGANVVLALAGAVVSAERFWCSPVRVFTSMRTQDSLEESTSSFYAELKRLQTLIQLTKQPSKIPVLYFLDEILKGTNSADRHRGAEALIRQLHHTTASGFVSTHDLELGQLTDADDFVRNYHFQSDLDNGELLFDYKLREGICQSFNASQLMQAIGIEMDALQKK
ncbi:MULTISPECIES: DNA mismatch repair protein MutS [unclassified Spirosoma]|uniref:MutS-related protein n=1 Tax=unclassified Spirosoma TaxID=2621999 RepID=UPI000960850F|nr:MULTISPECIES: DNA mismatch repair protein MutS [unclassified Spirosoma]MBN8825067.1 DNA mismatch repair protein MutS [Spirosoma sp.]OJW73355.1 MAG: DNA mismatch repair protein MutS [Spirosoma sp. 48-14]